MHSAISQAIRSAIRQSIEEKKMQAVLWTPATLFAASEPGVWYDPSDMSTMFQDAAGTTPVTAVEQPVGLILDKSKGLVLGPDLETDAWSTPPAGITYSGGTFTFDGTTSQNNVVFSTNTPSVAIVAGKTYQVSFTIFQNTTLPVGIDVGGVLGDAQTAAGTYTRFITATSSTGPQARFRTASGARTGSIGNISVRELPGNHATQSTTTSRPVLSARYNLLTKTEQFDDVVWEKGAATITANTTATTDPLGTNTADILVEDTAASAPHFVSQNLSATSGVSYTYSVYAKAAGRNWLRISAQVPPFTGPNHAWFDLQNGVVGTVESGTTASIASFGNGWFRCSWTRAAGSTSTSKMFICAQTANNELVYTGDGTSGIYIWGASLVPANQASLPYQRVNTATDYDADPSKFKPYLRFDGVDDWLVTPTITPGTDKAQVFAGVRKLSDFTQYQVLVESSLAYNSNNGAFILSTSWSAGQYATGSRGTSFTNCTTSPLSAPRTDVATMVSSIADDTLLLRINGTQAASSTGDQGTGNYLAYPLYIGRRGGTTLPFNGQLYGLIVRFGANLPAGTIASTETWLNQRTGAY